MDNDKYGYKAFGITPRIIAILVGVPVTLGIMYLLFGKIGIEVIYTSLSTACLLMFWPGADRIRNVTRKHMEKNNEDG